jgi:hypothetical protein
MGTIFESESPLKRWQLLKYLNWLQWLTWHGGELSHTAVYGMLSRGFPFHGKYAKGSHQSAYSAHRFPFSSDISLRPPNLTCLCSRCQLQKLVSCSNTCHSLVCTLGTLSVKFGIYVCQTIIFLKH